MDRNVSSERLRAIIQTQNEIASTRLDLDEVMRIVAERARGLTGADAAVMELPEGDEMVYATAVGAAAPYRGVRLQMETSLSGMCLRENKVLRCDDASSDPRVDRDAAAAVGARSMICVPLRHDGEVAGVLKVYSGAAGIFNDEDVETLELLSGVTAAHMSHASRFELVTEEGRSDDLTGLGNRKAYEDALAAELSYCRRHGTILSLCLLDLDGFKALNARLGHAAGDEVLRGVAQILVQSPRLEDLVFRIGGDVFAILYRNTTYLEGELAAGRIVDQIAIELAGLGVTASYGAAETAGDPDFTAQADERLYAMKRNRAEGLG